MQHYGISTKLNVKRGTSQTRFLIEINLGNAKRKYELSINKKTY